MHTQEYFSNGKGLWFPIEIEEEEFLVFISAEALDVHFAAARRRSPRTAYTKNRNVIQSVARRKFLNGGPRPIKLGVADF
jgi:hypothetical protein